ncbi:MAG: glycine/sarcosine/betaine reductase component B subunit, partial [bacterium]
MSLRKLFVDIDDVVFADRTTVEGRTLYINKKEILEMIADIRFQSVELELAFPGESCRIASVGDIVQPTVKLGNENATFPGLLGEMQRAGTGESLFLRGVVVTETYETMKVNGLLLDMSGPAAEHTIFSQMIHVVIVAEPAAGVDKYSYMDALKQASLRVAVALAAAAKDCIPDEIKEYSLHNNEDRKLPKVAYVMYNCNLEEIQSDRLYGSDAMEALPTIMDPNEILDGALVNYNHDQIVNSTVTYTYQNQPIIEELYSRHGKDLDFVGLIVATVHFAMESKKRNAIYTTRLAQEVLKADILLVTKESGGHPQIDCAIVCDLGEEAGLQVAMIQSEFTATSMGSDESLLFNTPNAKVIVSAGCLQPLDLPKMDRVIGKCIDYIPYDKTPLDGPVKTTN